MEYPLEIADQRKFQQVWERVMKGKPNPIVVGSSGSASQGQSGTTPSVCTAETSDLPCFGVVGESGYVETALGYGRAAVEDYEKLQRQIPRELLGKVQELAVTGKGAVCQLETAYFLLTGDLLPTANQNAPTALSPEQRLRKLFRDRQSLQLYYQKTAFLTKDSCVTTLFLQQELALREEVQKIQALLVEFFCWKEKRANP